MVSVLELWLPIVGSAIAVFLASFVAWSVLPHHKPDVKRVPDEDSLVEFLARADLPPGHYYWPQPTTPAEMKSDAFQQRYAQGPWGNLTILSSRPSLGRNLLLVFLFYVLVSALVAYVTGQARGPGATYLSVFPVAAVTSVLAYCAGSIPNAIFFGKPGRFVLTDLIDGLVYGILTAAVFAAFWPRG